MNTTKDKNTTPVGVSQAQSHDCPPCSFAPPAGVSFFEVNMKGKLPAIMFYPGDWRRDVAIQMASFSTRGIWFELLCCMWDATERGKITGTIPQIMKLLGCDETEFKLALDEIKSLKIADVTERNGNVTVVNRRMVRDELHRQSTKLRVKRFRSKKDVTPNVTPCTEYENETEYETENNSLYTNRLEANMPEVNDKYSDIIKDIITDLNERSGNHYRTTNRDTRKHIIARIKDGFTLDDFKTVHSNMCSAWRSDPKMSPYLRPQTLYSTKFESYLNFPVEKYKSSGVII